MEAFSREEAERIFNKWADEHPYECCSWTSYYQGWSDLKDLFATKTFVPREPVVVHGPLPDKLPQFEGINYPIGGKPKETK